MAPITDPDILLVAALFQTPGAEVRRLMPDWLNDELNTAAAAILKRFAPAMALTRAERRRASKDDIATVFAQLKDIPDVRALAATREIADITRRILDTHGYELPEPFR